MPHLASVVSCWSLWQVVLGACKGGASPALGGAMSSAGVAARDGHRSPLI